MTKSGRAMKLLSLILLITYPGDSVPLLDDHKRIDGGAGVVDDLGY
jgi:hypothetical protein